MAKIKISQLTAKGSSLANTDLLPIAEVSGLAYITKRVTGSEVVSSAATLTVGTTAIASGTIGRVFFQGSGNVLQQSANLFWNNSNNALGLGASPLSTSRLDIRAKDGLSTSQSLRIRNSTDATTQFEVNGQGLTTIRTNGGGAANSFSIFNNTGDENLRIQENGIVRLGSIFAFTNSTQILLGVGNALTNGLTINTLNVYDTPNSTRSLVGFIPGFQYTAGTNTGNVLNIAPVINTSGGANTIIGLYYNPTLTSITGTTHRAIQNTTGDVIFNSTSGNVAIGGTSFGSSSVKVFAQYNGTSPSSSPADAFQMYSADIVGGNAAPHFRTENGNVVKLYQETTGIASAVFVQNAGTRVDEVSTFDGYTIAQVVKALRNLGILA